LAWFILDLFGAKKSLTLFAVLDDFARWKSATKTAFQGQIKRFLLIVGPKRASRSAEFVKGVFSARMSHADFFEYHELLIR
jgi:hypothetical protein